MMRHSSAVTGQCRVRHLIVTVVLAAAIAHGVVSGSRSVAHAVSIDWVTVGDPGNVPPTGAVAWWGAVNYEYRIGTYEVTVGQYLEFLNAVAGSDPYDLYDDRMATDPNSVSIARSGSSGSFTYSLIETNGNPSNRPITYVNWWDAARFANWLHNKQGDTETGAYTLNGQVSGSAPARNAGALVSLPTKSEWTKAAYFSPLLSTETGTGTVAGGYWGFATQSDTIPGNGLSGTNNANYYAGYLAESGTFSVTQGSTYSASQLYVTNVGRFSSSASYYGTFDQSGNVKEWAFYDIAPDSELETFTGATWRGGSWLTGVSVLVGQADYPLDLSIQGRDVDGTTDAFSDLGFRLVSPVPEPSAWLMAAVGCLSGGWGMRRRRGRGADALQAGARACR